MSDIKKMFSQAFGEMRLGAYDDEATQKLAECVKAVRETGKKAALSIVLVIAPNDNASHKIDVKVTAKVPEASVGAVIMFDDAEGNLQRSDPKQMQMFPDRKQPASIEARANSDAPVFDRSRAAEAEIVR